MTTTEAILETFAVDPEIAADLAIIGVTDSLDQSQRDALASALMRRMAEETAAIAQLEASLEKERAFIAARYAPQVARHQTRLNELSLAVTGLALHTKEADGYGKKKSRDVGAGTYGYRTKAAAPELQDADAYLTWAETNAPATLRVKPVMSLATAREYLTEQELMGVRREIMKDDVKKLIATDPAHLPPGYVMAPARDEYFVDPLPLAAIDR